MSIRQRPQDRLRCTGWFWLFFALVLVLSIAVLILASSIVIFVCFGDYISPANQSRQHRDDSFEHPSQFAMRFIVDTTGCGENILDRSAFESQPTGDVEKSITVLKAASAVAFDDVKRHRLDSAKPLIAGVTMKTVELFGNCERFSDVIHRESVNVESIVIEDWLCRLCPYSSTSTGKRLSTRTISYMPERRR